MLSFWLLILILIIIIYIIIFAERVLKSMWIIG